MKFGLLPIGGDRLVKARLAGRDPRDMVIVSFVDHIPPMFTLNSTKFICDPGRKFDWRFLTGLEICILIQPGIPGIMKVVDQICAAVKPHSEVHVWDIERLVGATFYRLPTMESIDKMAQRPDLWEWKLEPMPWTVWQNEQYIRA